MLSKKVVRRTLVLIVGTVICGVVRLAGAADRAEVFTGLVVQPMISPRLDGDDGFFEKGDAGKIDRNWFPGAHKNELPLENEVVDFGEGK
jgi:hypothetical protein